MEDAFDVTVVTQNVDNLHEKAGSTHVIHLHGELAKACSSHNPYDERCIETLTPRHSDVVPGTKAADGSLLRPFIVFFGESVPMLNRAIDEAGKADIFVIIGTSLNVYPAAGLVQYAPASCPVYLIDPDAVSGGNLHGVTHIQKGIADAYQTLRLKRYHTEIYLQKASRASIILNRSTFCFKYAENGAHAQSVNT